MIFGLFRCVFSHYEPVSLLTYVLHKDLKICGVDYSVAVDIALAVIFRRLYTGEHIISQDSNIKFINNPVGIEVIPEDTVVFLGIGCLPRQAIGMGQVLVRLRGITEANNNLIVGIVGVRMQ